MPPQPPLRDIGDDGSAPPSPPPRLRASLGKLVREFVPSLERQLADLAPLRDVPPTKRPAAPKYESVLQGPDRAPWPTSKWWRFILTLAAQYDVPLWCDAPSDRGKHLTRGELCAESKAGAARRKPIQKFVEQLLIELLHADKTNPQADLLRLQALAAILEQLFRQWPDFCREHLHRPPTTAFNPSYLLAAFDQVRDWFLQSPLARMHLTPHERARLVNARDAALSRIKDQSRRTRLDYY